MIPAVCTILHGSAGLDVHRQVKGVKSEEILTRPNMAMALAARIEEVPDSVTAARKKNVARGQPLEIRIDNYSSGESCALRGFRI